MAECLNFVKPSLSISRQELVSVHFYFITLAQNTADPQHLWIHSSGTRFTLFQVLIRILFSLQSVSNAPHYNKVASRTTVKRLIQKYSLF
jgi:hypothetical protein